MEWQIYDAYMSRLWSAAIKKTADISDLSFQMAHYAAPGVYEDRTEFAPLTQTTPIMGKNTVFVKGTIQFPKEIRSDEAYEDCLFIRFKNLGGTIYLDGEAYSGIDENRDRIYLRREWAGQTKELVIEGYFLTGFSPNAVTNPGYLVYAYFGRVDKCIEKYALDLQLLFDAYTYDISHPQEDNRAIRKRMAAAFDASIRDLDMNLTGDALRTAVQRADHILLQQLEKIDDGDVRSAISFVGHTHIDVAWLWQFKDTVRKCGHSFSNIIRLLERYPDFKFTNSQVQLLAFTKEYFPALYAQIKVLEKEGRWENVGSMWVESDCNITSGESLARQFLYGTTFLDREFSRHSRVGWLPDAFGFQANMPQILKKSGLDYFYSYKLHWQAVEKFPYGDFKWKGIDGSEVITATTDNPSGGYNGSINPYQIRTTKMAFDQQGDVDEIIFPYGFGDGGGGPTREMIETAARVKDYPGLPRSEITTAQGFFDKLEQIRDDLPTWFGELYIQTHRGTLTTEAFAKRENRRFETLYLALEKLGVMAEACGAAPDWQLLHHGWEKGLLLQFHDVLPGSSIDAVYEDTQKIYEEVFSIADRFLQSAGLDTSADVSKEIQIVNTLSWERDILASFCCPYSEVADGIEITADGETMPSTVTPEGDNARITFLAKHVNAMDSRKFMVSPAKSPQRRTMTVKETENGIFCENSRYEVIVDACGQLTRLLDKRAGREVLRQPGNQIKVFLDGPQTEDAWNIVKEYKKREIALFHSHEIAVTENNDLRMVIHVRHIGENVVFDQDIVMYHDLDRIDFVTDVDWRERNKLMRVYFPTHIHAAAYTAEVGFGAFERPTVPNGKLEEAKFEAAAHRWIDLSESNYGVALLNDCKYGHDVAYDTIGMTLLRSTSWPAEHADIGRHKFTYSLLPHLGSWQQADVVHAAQELNAERYVPCVIGGKLHTGLFTCDNSSLILDTVKKSENGEAIVIRIYEANGSGGMAHIYSSNDLATVVEANLVEEPLKTVCCTTHSFAFSFTPYEVKTFILELKRNETSLKENSNK